MKGMHSVKVQVWAEALRLQLKAHPHGPLMACAWLDAAAARLLYRVYWQDESLEQIAASDVLSLAWLKRRHDAALTKLFKESEQVS